MAEKMTTLVLNEKELHALLSAWGVVSAMLVGDDESASIIYNRFAVKERDGALSLTDKLGEIQERVISDLLDKIHAKLDSIESA